MPRPARARLIHAGYREVRALPIFLGIRFGAATDVGLQGTGEGALLVGNRDADADVAIVDTDEATT